MVGREYSTDACNNIAIEFISIPLERTDGIEMSFCGSLMMKNVLTISIEIRDTFFAQVEYFFVAAP